jgi:choline dehydrogenase
MSCDVIVVGAGSAGCVLAARLSEDPDRSVLLLEAGPDYPGLDSLPPEIASSHAATYTHDWGYASEMGLSGRPIPLRRAKLVGGCSATNAAIALRGTPQDYDEWSLRGNPGWSFAEVLPFFRRLESDADFDDDWHGREGPLSIRRYPVNDLTPVQGALLEACAAAGYPRVEDHNAPGETGAGPAPMNRVGGIRQSAALAYLAQARHRPNLTIRSGVLVDRVLLEGRRAVGVSLADPTEEVFYADRIILAAGTYGSPAILMRSGIGPAEHLEALGIPVRVDLPGVGQNLTDHPLFGLHFAPAPAALVKDPPIFQTVITLKSSLATDGHDLHILPCSAYPVEPEQSPTGAVYLMLVSVTKPLSRGWLRLRSPDPAEAPVIDPGYFTHPDDMPRMIEVIREARRLSGTPPLSGWTLEELYPGPQVSDAADLEAAVLAQLDTYHHPVGTCRMGPATDATAVVDARGNVHGAEDLSAIDASIMPAIPGANTNLPTIMLAERCAAWLVENLYEEEEPQHR